MLIRQNLYEIGIGIQIEWEPNSGDTPNSPEATLTTCLGTSPDPNNTLKAWISLNPWKQNAESSPESELREWIDLSETVSDSERRKEIYRKINRLIYVEQRACFLYFPFDFNAVSSKVMSAELFLNSPYMPENRIKDFYMEGGDQ